MGWELGCSVGSSLGNSVGPSVGTGVGDLVRILGFSVTCKLGFSGFSEYSSYMHFTNIPEITLGILNIPRDFRISLGRIFRDFQGLLFFESGLFGAAVFMSGILGIFIK